jgi:hypothetical protein
MTTRRQPQRPSPFRRALTPALYAGGALLVVVVILGAIAAYDVLSFDRTSGGTPPDYTDFSGNPIDWDSLDLTDDGFKRSGYVLDAYLDCTSGMISLKPKVGPKINYREVSERALHVHQPREACPRHGFTPDF